MACFTEIHGRNEANCEFNKYVTQVYLIHETRKQVILIPFIYRMCAIKMWTSGCARIDIRNIFLVGCLHHIYESYILTICHHKEVPLATTKRFFLPKSAIFSHCLSGIVPSAPFPYPCDEDWVPIFAMTSYDCALRDTRLTTIWYPTQRCS